MNPELFAVLAEALRDEHTGLNALAGDCPGVDGPLPACEIATAMEQAWVGRNPLPEEALADGPVCIIRQADEYIVGGNAQEAGTTPDVPVLIGVGMLLSETHTGLFLVSKLLGTALRSIVLKFAAAGPPGRIIRNGVEIYKPGSVIYPVLLPTADTNILLAATVVPFPTYDPWALGAHVAVTP